MLKSIFLHLLNHQNDTPLNINLYKFFSFLTLSSFFLFGCSDSNPDESAIEKSLKNNKLPSFVEIPNWVGVFEDTLPCVDCGGIFTVLDIRADSTYLKKSVYLGKEPVSQNSYSTTGNLKFDPDGEIIWLDSTQEKHKLGYALISDSILHMVGPSGKIIESARFQLRKM